MIRRRFLQTTGLAALGLSIPARVAPRLIKPPRLKAGDVVGIVSPASAVFERETLAVVLERMQALELVPRVGEHVLARRGYFAGTDAQRAADLHRMFGDPEVKAVLAMRGGWGCARLLPLLDFDLIARNPKPIIGYSDLTALLLGIYARTGLVTIHGPVGDSTWNAFSVDYFRKVLFEGEAVTMRNPNEIGDELAQVDYRVRTITPGRATGRLAGGNLTIVASMVGTPYLPDWDGHILFLEDIGESLYRIDRMLTQLGQSGLLGRLAGVVFGKCTNCGPEEGYGGLTMEEILGDHLGPLGVPAWEGAMIGHIKDKFTVPLGVEVEIDATAGTIRMLEAAVL